jgi:ComEC/Rec2-related protein
MKRPLVMVGLLYAAGILLGRWTQPALAALFAVSIGIGLLALAWSRGRALLLWALLPLAGWTNETARLATLAPDDLRNLFANGPEQIKVRGTLCAPPVAKIFERGAEEVWRSSVVIDTQAIERGGRWTTAFGRIAATAPGLLDSNYFAGRAVAASGVIHAPRGPLAQGLFDARRFYEEEGIYFQLQTESTNDWSLAAVNQTAPLAPRFEAWARRTLALGLPVEDEPLRLIWTLALDWKTPLTEQVEEPFLRAGTYHVFAVDGLRIGMLTLICVALLRAFQVPRAWCGVVVIPLIWCYAGLTGWPASAVRATIMMTIVVLGWALRRPVDLMNSLFAAGLIILCWDPRQLFQAGFQLSFVIVFGIAVLLPAARALVYQRMLRPDPFLPDTLRWRPPDWLAGAARYGADMLLLSWTAWLASIPLSAYYFHLFTPWSVPANFVVVPLTALTLMACAGSLLFGAWLPGVAILFNHAAWFYMKSIIVVSQWSSGWRPGSINMAAPAGITLAWYYLVVLTLASGWIFKTKFKRQAWAAIGAASLLLAVHLGVESRTTRITALPAQGGSVVFIDKPGMLVDCGSAFFASHELKPFLQAQGVNRLSRFCLTSGHISQSGGAEIIRTNFAIGQIDNAGQRRSGDHLDGWEVLHPASGEHHPRADDDALVMRKTAATWTVLLLSSLGRAGQDSLLEGRGDLRSDVVIAGLPEQDEPLCEPLLDAAAPRVIIVVDSEMPATRRAPGTLRDRLGRRGAQVFYCRDTGALTIALRAGKMEIMDATGEVLLTMID